MNLVSLQLETTDNFENNLDRLLLLISQCEKDSIILASELVLTGYSYENIDKANNLTVKAQDILQKLSIDKTIALTMLICENNKTYNRFFIFAKGEIVYTQNKAELFALNDEKKYFEAGDTNEIIIFDINKIKFGVLICFELRFINLWEKLRGADIIFVPAMWGKPRKEHYETLSKALAIANQCFVIASDSANEDMAKGSAIISPFGIVNKNDDLEILSQKVDLNDIKKMRRYMNVGIN